jgi:cell division protein FtsI/penicillin-binding protein 2
MLTEVDGLRRELPERRKSFIPSVSGMKVELTIDAVIQEICEREAARAAEQYSPESVTILVSEPATGKLLALANWPSFSLSEYGDEKISPPANQKNRALTDIYEPGSVFKIVAISAALNEGVVDAEEEFDCSRRSVRYF